MVNAVSRDPEDRSAFERQRAANGQEIFHPFRSGVAAVGQQAVVAHADAEASGNPPQECCECCDFPRKEEEGGDCADMKHHHEKRGDPINLITFWTVLIEYHCHPYPCRYHVLPHRSTPCCKDI